MPMPQPSKNSLLQTLQHPAFEKHQLSVSVLRTDRIHPVISGNKWMKLQRWIRKAKSMGVAGIISKGGPWSNHLHAAAYAGWLEGIPLKAIVKAKQGFTSDTIKDILQWNGRIIYTDHQQYNDEQYWENMAFVEDALYIPMGGEGPEGVGGVTDFFNRLSLDDYDYMICPIGTGTTLSGIAASMVNYQSLIGFDPGIHDKSYQALISDLEQQFPSKRFNIISDSSLKKFGQYPGFLPEKMNKWWHQWELPTDIIYTAKMISCFEHLVTDGFFETGSRILLIHTGGLQGNRSLPGGLLTFK
jgi:1-aminocyclopropane-1-carboxylate deaminase/D-cysteine desulfhydrase-like pyridoxal-dependent ACC family enzyme